MYCLTVLIMMSGSQSRSTVYEEYGLVCISSVTRKQSEGVVAVSSFFNSYTFCNCYEIVLFMSKNKDN